ncbi:unnamed protein product [Urochloa decumbens]|uniref:Uncharacterized protein n=1 Tax=Urochloa decumbens TaxID=240449 RepID=A0ABC9GI27_9POAL
MHRIKAHEISKGALLDRLVDAKLQEEYPQSTLEDRDYFERYEMDFEWHFDPKYCSFIGFEDYQRLVLRKETEYLDWDEYHKTYCTYKADQEFVEFYEKLSSKTKWVANAQSSASKHEWPKYKRLAYYQAVKIAAGYKNIRLALVFTGFSEYICSVEFDRSTYGAIASLYFEIWKRVAKKKMSFVSALKQVYDEGICESCRFEMKLELDYGPKSGPMKLNYDTYVAYINARVCENEAHLRIKEAVKKFVSSFCLF